AGSTRGQVSADGRGAGSVGDEIGGGVATASQYVFSTLKTARDALTGNQEVARHRGERQAAVADGEVANGGPRIEDVRTQAAAANLRRRHPKEPSGPLAECIEGRSTVARSEGQVLRLESSDDRGDERATAQDALIEFPALAPPPERGHHLP